MGESKHGEGSAVNAVKNPSVRLRRIRVKKEESAFVYCVLEAQEGICSYSTLDAPPGATYRDLELQIPLDQQAEVDRVLQELGDLVYDLDPRSSEE